MRVAPDGAARHISSAARNARASHTRQRIVEAKDKRVIAARSAASTFISQRKIDIERAGSAVHFRERTLISRTGKIVVFFNTVTVRLKMLPLTRSGLPSPFKSPRSINVG